MMGQNGENRQKWALLLGGFSAGFFLNEAIHEVGPDVMMVAAFGCSAGTLLFTMLMARLTQAEELSSIITDACKRFNQMELNRAYSSNTHFRTAAVYEYARAFMTPWWRWVFLLRKVTVADLLPEHALEMLKLNDPVKHANDI